MVACTRSGDRRGERGMALIGVLLLLMMMSGLCAALAVSGDTETIVSRNHQLAAEARAAAEAGLAHGIQLTIANLQNWEANGFADESAAMTRLLRGPDDAIGTTATNADNGSLETMGIPRTPARLQLAALPDVFYEVRLFDEDDPARGVTLSAADRARIGEDNQATNDTNERLVVRAIGYAASGIVATLEAMISPLLLPAIVTNNSLAISGNPSITGSQGGVHSNQNLTVSGNPTIEQNATASAAYSTSGSPDIGGTGGGGYPNLTIPQVRASDYLDQADFILHSDGRLEESATGTIQCNASSNGNACKAAYAWVYNGPNGWAISSNDEPPEGTYYIEGRASISGNIGPVEISIIAEGSIDLSGNVDLTPRSPELLFVTDGDLKIGGLVTSDTLEGQILVHEQLMISGNPTLAGQILVEDAATASTLVTNNTISGNPEIVYNGIAGSSVFTVSAWRRIQ
jgi:hypothetical protein